jgi:hypothetical protein
MSPVADKITRHYCIQVDNTNSFTALVKQHVADLRVMMGDTKFHVTIF